MKRTAVLSVFCLGAAFLLTGCGEEEESSSVEPRRFTTTFVSYGHSGEFYGLLRHERGFRPGGADRGGHACRGRPALRPLRRKKSALSALNRAAGTFVSVPEPLSGLLRSCGEWADETGGSASRWERSWMCGRKPGEPVSCLRRPPCGDALARAKEAALEWGKDGLRLTGSGAALDLGCVAKGAAADEAADRLLAAGFDTFLLDCGTSSLRCSGAPPGREGWTAALVNPDSRLNLSGSASPVAALGILVLQGRSCRGQR